MREFPASGPQTPANKPRGKVIPMPVPPVVRRRRYVRVAMTMLGFILVAAVAGRVYLTTMVPPSAEQLAGVSADEARILDLVNHERVRAGVAPLKLSARVAVAARGHSYDMALRHYFSHQSADGVSPEQRLRGNEITYTEMGENIYMDDLPGREEMPQRAVQAWSGSPSHRKNMLSPHFNQTGVGVARTADGAAYVTQDFIRR
jgi:uncharacterized protein YkwD